MTKEELKEALKTEIMLTEWEDSSYADCVQIEVLKEALEALSAELQEWISVKDRLPEKSGIYYVTIQDKNGYRYVAKDRFYYDHKYFKHINYYKCLDSEIIAWQPITEPSPYKGE